MSITLALNQATVSPQLSQTYSAIQSIDNYVHSCLAVSTGPITSGGITISCSFATIDPQFAQAFAATQARAREWQDTMRLQLTATVYGMVRAGNLLTTQGTLSTVLQIHTAVQSTGGAATSNQHSSAVSAMDEFNTFLQYALSMYTATVAHLKTFGQGLQTDHDALTLGALAISAFKSRMQTAILNQMEQLAGSPFGAGIADTLGQVATLWNTALDNLSQSLTSILDANEIAQQAIGNLQIAWTSLRTLASVAAGHLQAAEAATLGSVLQDFDLAAALKEWSALGRIADTYNQQLWPQAATAAG